MEYLRLEKVSKSYGEKVLFSNLDYTINKGEKVAIIAKNGNGKSTLLRIIMGHESSDGQTSRVHVPKGIRLHYLEQEPVFHPSSCVMDSLFSADNQAVEAIKVYETALASSDDEKIQHAIVAMDDTGAWDIEARMKEVLYRMNLTDLDQPVSTLSGGQQKRLAIARMVLEKPDMVLLDEPTNHLDIEMVEWLEDYLLSASMTILMVTHDRYFMERICDSIIEIDKGRLFKYDGNYSSYLEKKAILEEQYKTTISKAKKLYLKELEWVRRQPQARGTKARARVNQYELLKDKVSSISYDDVFDIEIDSSRLGKKIVEFYDAGKSFDDHVIIRNFWYKFKNGENVGICGKNGSGKTTLVNLITGATNLDSGKRIVGDTVVFGYYRQDGLSFNEGQRVIDVITDVAEYLPLKKGRKLSAERLLENFMFDRKQQLVRVSQLSGGEKKRLHLLKVLMSNPNFLILDEPTNDLDVLTLNVLEDYLTRFTGCVVVVTHDRYFMDKLVDHLFILSEGGTVEDFNGTYTEWRAKDDAVVPNVETKSPKEKPRGAKPEPVRKLSYLEKREMQEIEERLSRLEKRKKEINQQFLTGASTDSKQIESLSIEIGSINEEIDRIEMRWLQLSEAANL